MCVWCFCTCVTRCTCVQRPEEDIRVLLGHFLSYLLDTGLSLNPKLGRQQQGPAVHPHPCSPLPAAGVTGLPVDHARFHTDAWIGAQVLLLV